MRSMDSPRRRRSSCASRRPIDLTTSAAGIKLIEVHIDPATKATVGFPTTSSPVRRVLVQGVDYIVETAPNIDAGGTLVQIVPLRPLLANNDAPGATRPRDIGYLVLVTNALRAANGAAIDADADYATIKTAALANTCATITDARLNALCNLARAHFGAAGVAGVSPATIVVSSSFTTQSVDTVLRVITATVAASPPPATAVLPAPVLPTGAIVVGRTEPGGSSLRHHHAALLPGRAGRAARRARAPSRSRSGGARRIRRRPPRDSPTRRASSTSRASIRSRASTRNSPCPCSWACREPTKPAAGWPIVIYQHGITEDRGTLALIADAAAAAGLRHRRHRPAPARHHAERSALRALAHESHGPGVRRHSRGLPRRRAHVQRGLREQHHHGSGTRWHSRFLRPALHQSRERADGA